ncbi:MAG TPA: NUDIX hydrolase [Vicinamibacteria bacterium]|jgi:ADP-ribose pyrophosphatase
MDPRRLSHRRVYDGKVLALDVDEIEEGGARALREVVRHRGSVGVLAVDGESRVVLVRQYRYPVGERLWELPAGLIEPGESPEGAARRELEEEVGLRAARLEPLCSFYTTPGFCDETMHLFRAAGLAHVDARPDEDEFLEARWFTPAEARALRARGEVKEGKTLVAVLLEEARGTHGR